MLSPSTMITNSWNRSAKWPGSIAHSTIGVRPIVGTQYRASGAARSTARAASHRAHRAPPSTSAPPIHSGMDSTLQVRIWTKFRWNVPDGVTATTKAFRTTCRAQ